MQLVYDLEEMFRAYRDEQPDPDGRLVSLDGINGCDGYNPSGAVRHGDHTYFYVRVEPRNDEFAYWSVPFCRELGDRWRMDPSLPMLHVQDPFAVSIGGRLIVGGVSVLAKTPDRVFFETILLEGESPEILSTFARGPLNMKDVRLVELRDGRIGIFTRPLGGDGGRGRIGYTEVDDLEHVTAAAMRTANMLPTQPVESQWWGVNDAHLLADGCVGVIGHMARLEGQERHYYAVAFVFDPVRHEIVQAPKIVADRSRFPGHSAKRNYLRDVVFPAWFDRESSTLLCGLSDSAVGILPIEDPFAEYERSRQ